MCVCIVPSPSPREIYIHDMILLQLESCGLEKEVFNIWLRILDIHMPKSSTPEKEVFNIWLRIL